jgi:hypothetical protein
MLPGVHEADEAGLAEYARAARTADGFAGWLEHFLAGARAEEPA